MKLRRIPIYTLAFLNAAVILGLLLTGYSDRLNPESWPLLSLAGYAFPFFLVATLLMMVVWVFVKKRYMLMSAVGLLMAYQPVTLYCPVNPSGLHSGDDAVTDSSEGRVALKVLSFNTCYWGSEFGNDGSAQGISLKAEMLDYLASTDADVICLQEAMLSADLDTMITHRFPVCYTDTIYGLRSGAVAATILSRYPIVRKQRIDIPSVGNGVGAFWIEVPDKGKGSGSRTLCIVNCHLETMALTHEDKEQFSSIVHGIARGTTVRDTIRSESRFIVRKISAATQKRAPQADCVAQFVERQIGQGSSVLVCGDFNDIPHSYVRRRIQGDNLTDCYRETGFGPGFSIHRNAMRVRIDNILCTKDIEPLSCYIDHKMPLSDHYPIVCTMLW